MIIPQLESILFVASRPLSTKQLARALDCSVDEVVGGLETLQTKYNRPDSGIHLLLTGTETQFSSNPAFAELVEQFTKKELSGELTVAQLESLTVIAYQQPITRPELEQIRGVNCAVILRNLLQRGLIEETETKDDIMPVYTLSVQALRFLGITSVKELPEYESFHQHAFIEERLNTTSHEG